MKRLVIDLDNTICTKIDSYADAIPNPGVVEKLKEYHSLGFEIVIHTSRNMRTYNGNVGKINVHTLPTIISWLNLHNIPYDEIVVGKPWCGHEGFYVDDRAIRPSEFALLTHEQIQNLMETDKLVCK